jgi:hypothetical protein
LAKGLCFLIGSLTAAQVARANTRAFLSCIIASINKLNGKVRVRGYMIDSTTEIRAWTVRLISTTDNRAEMPDRTRAVLYISQLDAPKICIGPN